MKTYLITILTVSVVGGIINSLIDSSSKIKKYINYLISLICVVCLVAPIGNVIGNISSIKAEINEYFEKVFVSEKIDASNDLIINTSKEKICDGIKNSVLEKYNFDEKEVFVDLTIDRTDIGSLKIEKINVVLTGKASWSDVKEVEEYLKNTIGSDIEVKRK